MISTKQFIGFGIGAGFVILVPLLMISTPEDAGANAGKEGKTTIKSDISYYADRFEGQKTASGEEYDPDELTAAHKKLPLGTKVRVKNPENKKSVVVEINDRGPYASDRALDVSKKAARKLGIIKDGEIEAHITVVDKP